MLTTLDLALKWCLAKRGRDFRSFESLLTAKTLLAVAAATTALLLPARAQDAPTGSTQADKPLMVENRAASGQAVPEPLQDETESPSEKKGVNTSIGYDVGSVCMFAAFSIGYFLPPVSRVIIETDKHFTPKISGLIKGFEFNSDQVRGYGVDDGDSVFFVWFEFDAFLLPPNLRVADSFLSTISYQAKLSSDTLDLYCDATLVHLSFARQAISKVRITIGYVG